jgi:hypothetical protein
MKKVKFDKKLSLNKETVTKLNNEQMSQVVGGEAEALSWFRKCGGLTCSPCKSWNSCVAE